MAVSSEQIEKALRTSLKEAERLRQQNQQLLAKRSEPRLNGDMSETVMA